MARRVQFTIIGAVLLLFAGAIGAYAWDASKQDQIAKGIRIGEVDVGGMNTAQAREKVKQDLVAPLAHPLKITYGGHRWTLGVRRLHLKVDLDGMIAEATDASRSGSVPSRVWRYATGGSVDRQIAPRLSYSKAAVNRFVKDLADQVDRDAQDATVAPTPSSLNAVPGKDGRKLDDDKLRQQIEAEVGDPRGVRQLVRATVHRTKPKLTTDQLASKYPAYVTIDRAAFSLKLWTDLKEDKSYTIAVGQQGLETPAGLYHVEDKAVNPSWHVPNSAWAGSLAGQTIPPGPLDPIKARWMGIFNGAGIHGTDETWSLGQAVSHGCIRMSIPDVIDLYDRVSVGTPVYIGD
jgi:lipoprotein-anchoring transpeptidase ErfK/SrfK